MRLLKRRLLLWAVRVTGGLSLWFGNKLVEDVERETAKEPHWMGR